MPTAKRATAKKRTAAAPQAKAAATAKGAPPAAGEPLKAAGPRPAKQGAVPEKAADKADKAKKPKVVRDSFTMPKPEYAQFGELKLRAAHLGRPVKKSEVLRAGLRALATMGDAAFLAAIGAIPSIKTGRPAKNSKSA